jgi:hypothetical protein
MVKVSVVYEIDDKEWDTVQRFINTLINFEIPKSKVLGVGILSEVNQGKTST